MPTNSGQAGQPGQRAFDELSRLRRHIGTPQQFWQSFMAASSEVAGAVRCVLVLRDPTPPGSWKKLGEWNGAAPDRTTINFNNLLADLAQVAMTEGSTARALEGTGSPDSTPYAVGVRLVLQRAEEVCVAVFLLASASELQAAETLMKLKLVADIPLSYQSFNVTNQTKVDVEKFASALDLMVLVNAETRFLAATLALCNGVAARFGCDRVSVGWLEGGFIRLKSISRTERFERKMEAVRLLEVAMEECLDQDEEIVLPPVEGSNYVSRDHEAFAKAQSVSHLASIPIRVDNIPVAVLSCERQSHAFNEAELQQLRLVSDQAGRRLADLHRNDRWFGARLANEAREKMATWLGPDHTWAKLAAVFGAAALIVMLMPVWKYRVEGTFTLKSDVVSYLTAPFDGYIKSVRVEAGDAVTNKQPMVQLNTVDLELDEASANADLNRFQREAERARATNALAEMRINLAQADQIKAKLSMVRYRLDQATVRAPFDAVVAEGDLRQRIGAPVKQGEALFKVSELKSLFVEAEISERDIHHLQEMATGEIAFLSQPRLRFPVQITRIEPAGFPKREGNVFIVRLAIKQAYAPWWRPGMSGICKIDSGRRSLMWILTHRTIDFLRLHLWW